MFTRSNFAEEGVVNFAMLLKLVLDRAGDDGAGVETVGDNNITSRQSGAYLIITLNNWKGRASILIRFRYGGVRYSREN